MQYLKKYDKDWLLNKYYAGDQLECLYFWGHTRNSDNDVDQSCLSQWYESSFSVYGQTYKTAEHWMMAQKALLFENMELKDEIIDSNSPLEAKKLGREVIGFDENKWNEEKLNIVFLGNIHKFNQNRTLGEFLLSTKDTIIVEASPVDRIWGVGMAKGDRDINNVFLWKGENLLGFILMEVRDFLCDFGFLGELQQPMEAPWVKFPNVDFMDLNRWGSHSYVDEFDVWFEKLSEREKTIFQIYNPAPFVFKFW